jgi:hypothetical protein
MSKKVIANEIKEFDDGSMEVDINFNPFEHGHKLGTARNYNINKYKDMVTNKVTQTHIKNGYALGTISHDYRDKNTGMLLNTDENGDPIIPICKTLKMEWNEGNNNPVSHRQRILNNKLGKEIQILIKNGIGGFSSAHNLNKGAFFGFDYVIYPNFTTNRVIVDNVCQNGMCSFDAIISIKDELKSQIGTYLDSIGFSGSDDVLNALVNIELNTKQVKNDIQIANKIKTLKSKAVQFDDAYNVFKSEVEEKYLKLVENIGKFGLKYDNINNDIVYPNGNLDKLFKKVDFDSIMQEQENIIKEIKLRK